MNVVFTLEHAHQVIDLWLLFRVVQLDAAEDGIVRKFMASGAYTADLGLQTQFHGTTSSEMNKLVWKT